MRRRLRRGSLVLAFLLGSGGRAMPAERRPLIVNGIRPLIVNGAFSSLYPSTGALLDSPNFASAALICSGTLIGCETFLTAGHCVEGNLNPTAYSVFFQHAGFFHVASIALHPAFNFPVGDIAVLKLSTPVTGIAPTPISSGAPPAFGTAGTIVGFGRSGGGFDYGLKRAGAVTTTSCSGGVSNTTSVCSAFNNPLGPPGSNSNTCNGDSGGPLLVGSGGGMAVAGVASGGNSPDCQPPDNSYDANVAFYAPYIQTEGGADLANTTCGGGPQAGEADASILAATGDVSAGSPEGRHSFIVPSGIGVLRVAMNAVDDGVSDFNLYVKAGSPPTTGSYDCRQIGTNQYGFCEFNAPAPGTWHVLVSRDAGAGTYQVTTTLFGVGCSTPGNDGRACDDGNPCTGTDTCQSGTCTGTPVANGLPCDDGSTCTTSDACQAGICAGSARPDGTACDDGHICTRGDGCQAGICTAAAPALGCKQSTIPFKGNVQLKNDDNNDARDRLTWHWKAGDQTAKVEFGNPAVSTALGLCVYDETGNVPQLVLERTIPAGAFWTETATGFKYNDRTLANSGLRTVALRSGLAGRASITVKAQGPGIEMVPLPLNQQSKVTVQLVSPDACWGASYSTHLLNQADLFKARAD